MVEAYGLAQMGQAPVLQPTNRWNPKPSPAPGTAKMTARTSIRSPSWFSGVGARPGGKDSRFDSVNPFARGRLSPGERFQA